MSDAEEGRKLSQAGKTNPKAGQQQRYDVEQVIAIVRTLGEQLIYATTHSKRRSKHHFRKEWLEQLIDRYRRLPGKTVIHLDDLGDGVIPTLSSEARAMLLPYWSIIVRRFGSEWGSQHFRCVRDIVVAGKASRWSKLKNWRQFGELTGFHVNELEPYLIALRASGAGKSRVIMHPKLPFNLATTAGAKIIGYRGDAAYRTSAFHNLDPVLHEDYKQAIIETIGENPFTTTSREDGLDRTNVGVVVTLLMSLAGIDTTQRQKLARNPFPSWFFVMPDDVVSTGLRANYDAEGSPGKQLQLGQGVSVSNSSQKLSALKPKVKKPFSWLEESAQHDMGSKPPLLLVSTSLLLYHFGIVSYMSPQKAWKNKAGDYTVFWNLNVYRMKNMRLFRDHIGFLSPSKLETLIFYINDNQDPSSSPSFFFRWRGVL